MCSFRSLLLLLTLAARAHAFAVTTMKSLVVISPPGGVGEVTAVKAATMGGSVKWFVVGLDKNTQVALSPEALQDIEKAGGIVELAGADAPSLLGEPSAIAAVNQWCANADGLVCCMDGVELASKGKIDEEDPKKIWMDGIKVAAKEAGRSIKGIKIAVLPANEDDSDTDEKDGGVGGILKSVISKDKVDVPSSLSSAMAAGGNVVRLRHGDLFGIPESSVRLLVLLFAIIL